MVSLTKKEFDVLVASVESDTILSQRDLETITGHSLATINRTVKDLIDKGLYADSSITNNGINILESYKAKKAIFIAAGFGSRLVPVTLNTPKPLVRINGKRLIDGLIDAVLALGINDITIVRGYLGEQFDQLLYKYPMIKLLENPLYNEANNISSIMCARFNLENAYVLESDLLIKNPNILKKYHYCSDYLCSYQDRTDDWCFTVKDNTILEEKVGGIGCYQMKGISYWNASDGKKLSDHLKQAYEAPGGKELYWEQVPLVKFHDEYHVEICECKEDDIIEIDTYNELKNIDKTYNV